MYEVCTNSLYKQLSVWKMLVNKDNLNELEEKKLKDFTVHHNRDGGNNNRPRLYAHYQYDTRRGNCDDCASPGREQPSGDRTRHDSSSRT